MDVLKREVEGALDARLYYLAVMFSLTLPDICAALESPSGTTNGARYKAWYETWLASAYSMLTADDMWSLRNGVVHQGKLGHPKMQYSRVLFTVPSAQQNVFHNNIINDALNLDAPTFCRDILAAVDRWYAAMSEDPNVQSNLPRLIQYREHGLPPYLSGMPLIA